MDNLLQSLLESGRSYTKEGQVATYIPELSKANPDDFGICVLEASGQHSHCGDYSKGFTMQSVVKPLLLLMALEDYGEEFVRSRVGVESTGKPFDAINVTEQALVRENLNPMVNMGAIAMCSLIHGSNCDDRFDRLLAFTRSVASDPFIHMDEQVYLSEKRTGNRNRALAFLLKSSGLLEGDVEEVLDLYFRACSLRVTACNLAKIGLVLANHGVDPITKQAFFHKRHATYVNAVLMTCGMYDGSGEFACKVGIPAKSGVGGGIMALVPGRMGIGIYSPALDAKGNSLAGCRILESLSRELDLSIF